MSCAQPAASERKRRVLVIEDQLIMRQGIKLLINQEPDLVVCGEVENAAEALRSTEQFKPDLAIVDLSLRDSSGLDLIKDLHARHPHLAILVLSTRDDSFYAERVLRAGARGYVTREDGRTMVDAIRRVLGGQIHISDKIAFKIIGTLVNGNGAPGTPLVQNLSDRELMVFELIGNGRTTREIARKLHISIKTVHSHREHIKDKLQLANATDLLKHAIEWVQLPTESAPEVWNGEPALAASAKARY